MSILIAVVVTVLVIFGIFKFGRSSGRESTQNKAMEKIIDDIHTAKMARDGLRNNPSLRDKLRSRHERQ